jgi:hypothetical protein
LTVTGVAASVVQTTSVQVLTGTVSDGGPVGAVYVMVEAPSGELTMVPATWSGGAWAFEMAAVFPGSYRLWPTAVDLAGNETAVGPYDVTVTLPSHGESRTYLPMIAKAFVAAPDLVVAQFAVSETGVVVVIRNDGMTAATDAFWVDLYVDPDPVPSAVNQVWSDLAAEGFVWGVTTPLAVGEAITLTADSAFAWDEYSAISWPLAVGTPVYVQVDSANAATDFGGVREVHEILGEAGNNIAATSVVAGSVTASGGESVRATTVGEWRLPVRP